MAARRFLALGDSYTIGEQVPAEQRWCNQLSRLEWGSTDLGAPLIIAQTGWTADELEVALDQAEQNQIAPPYDLVSLLIGVNDQYRGREAESFAPAFSRLLTRAIGYAGGDARRVLVVSIPDWGVTPFAREEGRDRSIVAAEIDAYNQLSRGLSESAGVHYVGITDLTREAAKRPELLAGDGLHPSGSDYGRWASRIQGYLLEQGWPFD